MKSNKALIYLLASLGLLLQSCAHEAGVTLDQKLAAEKTVTPDNLRTETKEVILDTPGLKPEQRTQLSELRKSVRASWSQLDEDSLKLRALLVKDLVSPDYDRDEVDLIKKRLESNEKKRLATLFNAIDKANHILGHEAARHPELVHDIFPYGARL